MKWLGFIFPAIVITAIIALLAQRPLEAPALSSSAALPCAQPPVFKVGYQRDVSGLLIQGHGYRFQGNSWLETIVCQAGTLKIQAEGEPADGQNPILTVNLNAETITRVAFPAQEQSINVRIPKSGRLILAYLNDFYLADVRTVSLEQFKLTAAGCHNFSVNVPEATGGQWSSEYKAASLVSDVPMTLTPCAAGELRLVVTGRAGLNVFPQLDFKQGGQTLLQLNTTAMPQRIRLRVSAAPLRINLSNPYGRTVADRNLSVKSLIFIPDLPNSR